MRPRIRSLGSSIVLAALGLSLVSCSAAAPQTNAGDSGDTSGAAGSTVTLVVHDSFVDAEAFSAAASAATGYDVKVVTAGDGGELTNKLVLTAGAPIADAFFGVDNTFASRLLDSDAVAPVTPSTLPARAATLAEQLRGNSSAADGYALVPIDLGATCVNIDTTWFAEHGVAEPQTFDDLAQPAYRGLTVLLDPTASSTGASFMIATVAAFGENGFADYWQRLVQNDARVDQGWEDAYYGDFTGASDTGTFPIVVSYSTSPAFTVTDDGSASTTRALLDTCSTQVEYAGVLAGASNPKGAAAVIDYLLSSEFQQIIPDEMYMYPVDEATTLPEPWAKFAPLPSDTQVHDLDSAEISTGLSGWLKQVAAAANL